MRKGSVVIAFAAWSCWAPGRSARARPGRLPRRSAATSSRRRCTARSSASASARSRSRSRSRRRRPTNVSLSLDAAHAASAVVGAAGGNVEAHDGRAGLSFTLRHAGRSARGRHLHHRHAGLALAGYRPRLKLVSGVQFGPNGLATREARDARDRREGRRRAGSPGSTTAATPTATDNCAHPRAPSSRVTHFSGVGHGRRAGVVRCRTRAALTVEFARYVRPLLRPRRDGRQRHEEAFGRAFAWEHDAARPRTPGRVPHLPSTRSGAPLEKALANALRRADEKCRNHDLTQLDRLLRIERIAQLARRRALPSPSHARACSCAARTSSSTSSFEATTEKIKDIGPAHSEERTSLRGERGACADRARATSFRTQRRRSRSTLDEVAVPAGHHRVRAVRTASCSRPRPSRPCDRSAPRASQGRRADAEVGVPS